MVSAGFGIAGFIVHPLVFLTLIPVLFCTARNTIINPTNPTHLAFPAPYFVFATDIPDLPRHP